MKVLCDKETKKIEGFSRRGGFDFDPNTHIVIDVDEVPNFELDRLNDTGDDIRWHGQTEIDQQITAQTINLISSAIQFELDKEAQIMGYDNIHTAVTYADESAVAQFQADGQSFRAWRSLVWEYAYAELAAWQDGGAEPTIEDIIAGMPARV